MLHQRPGDQVVVMTQPKKLVSPPLDPAQPVVAPAYHPEPRPLKVGSLRQIEGRAGAYAYRDVPSMMGGQRVPYVSSLDVIGSGSAAE